MASLNSFNCKREMSVRGGTYTYFDLKEAEKNGIGQPPGERVAD